MKKLLKSLMVVALMFTLALTLTGCGNTEKTKNNNGGNTGGNEGNGSTVSWPSNQYIDLLPKPTAGTIYEEKPIDNYYYLGHSVVLKDITMQECKNYAEEVMNAGFNIIPNSQDDLVVTDTEDYYSFGGNNSDDIYASVGGGHNTCTISVYAIK